MRLEADEHEVIVVDEQLTRIADVSYALRPPLQHLNISATTLRQLNVAHNAIGSLAPLATLSQLVVLKCSHNQISSLQPVASLKLLRELWISDNAIESAEIEHLRSLVHLQILIADPNPRTAPSSNYPNAIVRVLPWLERLDCIVVDDDIRSDAQLADERADLTSASTVYTTVTMLTDTDADFIPVNPELDVETSEHSPSRAQTNQQHASEPDPMRGQWTQTRSPTKVTSADSLDSASQPVTSQPIDQATPHSAAIPVPSPSKDDASNGDSATLSSIASAVASLPLFSLGADGSLLSLTTKKKPSVQPSRKAKPKPKAGASAATPPPATTSVQQDELRISHPNSTVVAVHVRSDGSAVAKWPNGAVAVSVDREAAGFRIYAAHRDGTIALSFDPQGVGFINYYPGGKMMISTTSSGDGLYFSSDNGRILRQWDSAGYIRDENMEETTSLGMTEGDKALVVRLGEGLGFRLLLTPGQSNPIDITVCVALGSVRHALRNGVNISATNSSECEAVLGKEPPKSIKKAVAQPVEHVDFLSQIRAAVSGL
ncbi:TPA: hypothetical protein N0F65_001014 [Lagenidium giganteum]|uniref:Uncharacterized protein n=1 Tax=Lagenidium giganteum TaxID=4803 RepID=A0AAV2YWR5_9STRA|nr:TPA: hypothetical protein N0F65_001014 [Lagenidium giganteum]